MEQNKLTGLTTTEAKSRLEQYGANTIESANQLTAFKILIEQFKSALIYVLIATVVIAVILEDYRDAVIIAVVVILNVLIGFAQEYRAESSLSALNQRISKLSKVIRDGDQVEIPTEQIVPGDLIVLDSGTRVPADGDILDANELQIDEAVLTGESEPVLKDPEGDQEKKVAYKGSLVVGGTGMFVATTTGANTKFGQIAKSLQDNNKVITPVKQEIVNISKLVIYFVIFVSAVVALVGFAQDLELQEIYKTIVALGVSVIPEGLLIAFTVTLAIGMNRIMARGAVVKNLPAAETLGSVNTLCVDKTGTLTKGQMQVVEVQFSDDELGDKALVYANNDNNFIDKAIQKYIFSKHGDSWFKDIQVLRQKLFPFSSTTKYSAAHAEEKLFVVGAPEVVSGMCLGSPDAINKRAIEYAEEGYRVLAAAYKTYFDANPDRSEIYELNFLGFILVKDPPRENLSQYLQSIKSAGIELKLITGDLLQTTRAILQEAKAGIPDDAFVSGKQLREIEDEQEFDKLIAEKQVFYRTTPDQKLSIVQSLQRSGKKVAMMGDGVNDAPAIKSAEIGITVDNATDVSKEVSDIVLLDTDFKTIVFAIAEGRGVFDNLRKIVTYLLSTSFTNTTLILLAILFGVPVPITPIQILWINLVEDGFPGLALGFNRPGEDVLKRKPRSDSSIFNGKVISTMGIITLVTAVLYFFVYMALINTGNYSIAELQTITFASVALTTLFFMYSVQSIEGNIWNKGTWSNMYANGAFILGIIITLGSIYIPVMQDLLGTVWLQPYQLLLVGGLAVIQLAIIEGIKFVAHKLKAF